MLECELTPCGAIATVERIKRELARYHSDSAEAYYDLKDPVYDLIWQSAKLWAAQTNWEDNVVQYATVT